MSKIPKLNDDCFRNIFEYLDDDLKTLHSCIFVNRQWCKNIIPIFWRNPWKYSRKGKNSFAIINTYILILPKLIQQNLLKNEIISKNGPLLSSSPTPTFEYSKFLQSIILYELENDIKNWTINNNNNQLQSKKKTNDDNVVTKRDANLKNFKRNKRNLMYELLKFFFINSPKLDTIYFSDFNFSMEIIGNDPIIKNRISNLKNLQIGSRFNLSNLLKISNNVENLEIVQHILCSKEFKDFIIKQNNLKELKVKSIGLIGMPIMNSNINILNEIIEKKFIIRLIIKDSPRTFIILKSFKNLTELNIIYNINISKKYWDYMANASLKNLKKLIIESKSIYFNIISQFINNSSCDLEQIIITTSISSIIDLCDIGLYIDSISNNCPSLKIFEGVIGENNVSEFSQLLKNCSNLKSLHLYPARLCFCEIDNLVKEMINISLNNLSRLCLEIGWKLTSIEHFKNFIEKRKLLGLEPISIYTHKSFTLNYSEFLLICEDWNYHHLL